MKVLFIGRFQPFHKGHLKVIEYITKKYDKIIIGVGSSQYKDKSKNPFSFDERKEMIKKTLKSKNISNYKIIEIHDIHNPPKWVEHVLSIFSDFDLVVTNNSFTKKLFEEKEFNVITTPIFEEKNYSGKIIRKKIKNDEKWEEFLPEPSVKILKKINGIKRIKNS